MRAGNIRQFALLSQYENVQEFNDHKRDFLEHHAGLFTKSEFLAFELLSQYSVVVPGVANGGDANTWRKCRDTTGWMSLKIDNHINF